MVERLASVFISYAHADKELVRRVAAALKRRGHQVWIDHEELRVGDSLVERISNAIEEMDFVVAFLSTTAVTRPWARKELAQAIASGLRENGRVKVLPVRVGDAELPPSLADTFYAELDPHDPAGVHLLAERLNRDMAGHAGEGAGTARAARRDADRPAAAPAWRVSAGPRRVTPDDLDGEVYRWTLTRDGRAAHQLDVVITGSALSSRPVPDLARDKGRAVAIAAADEANPASHIVVASTGPRPWPPRAEAATTPETSGAASRAAAPREAEPLHAPLRLVRIDADRVTQPRNDGTRGSALYRVPIVLDRRPDADWVSLFVQAWDHPPEWTSMHRPGIASVVGDRVILDGTTLEEIERVHKKTLQLAVRQANTQREELERRRQTEQARERAEVERFRREASEASDAISFDD